MGGVNNLAQKWGRQANTASVQSMEFAEENNSYMAGRTQGRFDMLDECSAELDEIARTAWKPVSEPPTEEDGDWYGRVAVVDPPRNGYPAEPKIVQWDEVGELPNVCAWARIRDVLLMPEGEGE